MTCCPFHDDRHPSMKVDERFYCFGCQETGDVIDFTAKLFHLRNYEAAQKLIQDFGLSVDKNPTPSVLTKLQCQPDIIHHTFRILSDYIKMLEEWQSIYAPKSPQEPLHPYFITALKHLDKLRYYQDIFIHGSKDEQTELTSELQEDVKRFEREIRTYRNSLSRHDRNSAAARRTNGVGSMVGWKENRRSKILC